MQRNQVKGLITSPKSHQRRRVDMSSQLASTLLAWRRHQRERYLEKGLAVPEWVFAAAAGQVLQDRNVRTVITLLLEEAGLRHIRLLDLRHTFASVQNWTERLRPRARSERGQRSGGPRERS